MLDTFKFPKSNTNISIVRKKDVIDCIDNNIIDKDVAMAVINQCEIDIAKFANKGIWTGIPYIGNIRYNEIMTNTKSKENAELINEARENLTKEKYVLFRQTLGRDMAKVIRQRRYFNYITSKIASRNKKYYYKLCKSKGEEFSKLFMYFAYNMTIIGNDINYDYYE